MELSLVVLEDQHSKVRVGIYTNNTQRPASDIAYYMLQRWGKSENIFKELMDCFYLNYHPGYDIQVLGNSLWSKIQTSLSSREH